MPAGGGGGAASTTSEIGDIKAFFFNSKFKPHGEYLHK